MIKESDSLSFADGKINGELTVLENIADTGDLGCTLEATRTKSDLSIEGFFVNWATIWHTRVEREYRQPLLQIDIRAPTKFRTNVQPKNLGEFYETFGVMEQDAMYLVPEKRVRIWQEVAKKLLYIK